MLGKLTVRTLANGSTTMNQTFDGTKGELSDSQIRTFVQAYTPLIQSGVNVKNTYMQYESREVTLE